jgi:hypothetical protein
MYLVDANRLEIIDDQGRSYVYWGEEGTVGLEFHRQDDGRTLKIFVYGKRATPPVEVVSQETSSGPPDTAA